MAGITITRRSVAKALSPDQEVIDLALKMFEKEYNPDEARDDHGKWTSDGGSLGSVTDGLRRQAQQFGNYNEFRNAVTQQGLRPFQWHISSDPNFQPDPKFQPLNAQGSTGDGPALYLGDPNYWQEYAAGRGTVVEYDMSGAHWTATPLSDPATDYHSDQSGNPGMVVRASGYGNLQETGRMPLDQAISRADAQQSQMPTNEAELQHIWDTRHNITKSFLKYSEDQARDDHGRWTVDGGNGGPATAGEVAIGLVAQAPHGRTETNPDRPRTSRGP
jgi:hypothetical protein